MRWTLLLKFLPLIPLIQRVSSSWRQYDHLIVKGSIGSFFHRRLLFLISNFNHDTRIYIIPDQLSSLCYIDGDLRKNTTAFWQSANLSILRVTVLASQNKSRKVVFKKGNFNSSYIELYLEILWFAFSFQDPGHRFTPFTYKKQVKWWRCGTETTRKNILSWGKQVLPLSISNLSEGSVCRGGRFSEFRLWYVYHVWIGRNGFRLCL